MHLVIRLYLCVRVCLCICLQILDNAIDERYFLFLKAVTKSQRLPGMWCVWCWCKAVQMQRVNCAGEAGLSLCGCVC